MIDTISALTPCPFPQLPDPHPSYENKRNDGQSANELEPTDPCLVTARPHETNVDKSDRKNDLREHQSPGRLIAPSPASNRQHAASSRDTNVCPDERVIGLHEAFVAAEDEPDSNQRQRGIQRPKCQ